MGRWIENSLIQILISEKRSSMPASVAREGGKYKFFVSSHESLLSDYYSYIGEYLVVGNGGVANVHYVNGKFGVSSHSLLYSVRESNDTVFWYYQLYNSLETIFYKCFEGSGLKNLNSNKFYNLQFHYPESLDEQRSIADILSTVDDAIDSTQALIDKHEQIKEGMMHDLFTRGVDLATGSLRPHPSDAPELYQHSELGLIPKEWEVKRLDELIDGKIDNRGKTPPLSKTGYPLVETYHLENKSMGLVHLFDSRQKYVTSHTYKSFFRSGHPIKGDILFSLVGERIPQVNIFEELFEICIGQNMVGLRFVKNDYRYIGNYFKRNNFKQSVDKITMNQAQPSIKLTQLNEISIGLPISLDEQKVISSMINNIDITIKSYQSKKQKLLLQKQGLMQDLLSGKVRVM